MKTFSLLLILVGLAAFGFARAGDLEPPGPPAPTMVTLQDLFDRLDDCTAEGRCGVPKTGQTECWNHFGSPVDCEGTGQDGESQAGAAVEPRLSDIGDGTVKDNLTGLVWLKNADCFGPRIWAEALSDANTLAAGSCGLTDGSSAGDWRLPNVKELQSLMDYGQDDPALPAGFSFTGTASHYYWTSTSVIGYEVDAWRLYLRSGSIGHSNKLDPSVVEVYVWPVR